MTYPGGSAQRSSDLDDFLFAEVGIQPNGMPLTVLSLFARAGVDPWSEAERLSAVSRADAVPLMTAAIGDSPACPPDRADVTKLATRLVARLPARASQGRLDGIVRYDFGDISVLPLMTAFYVVIGMALIVMLAMI